MNVFSFDPSEIKYDPPKIYSTHPNSTHCHPNHIYIFLSAPQWAEKQIQ